MQRRALFFYFVQKNKKGFSPKEKKMSSTETYTKVTRTHSCVIDIYKATVKHLPYFKSYVLCKENAEKSEAASDSSPDEFQAYCPRCSSLLYDINSFQKPYIDKQLSCKACDVEFSTGDFKFVGGPEDDYNYKKRNIQWTEKVEIFLSNDEILHVRPYIVTSYISYSETKKDYVVARNTRIYKMAFNLKTGLSYFLGVVDGKGKPYSVVLDHGFMMFKRNRGNFPRLLRTQTKHVSAFYNVFSEISFIIKDIIKSTQFAFNLEKLEKVENFSDLSLWNRLKMVDSEEREVFYETFVSTFPSDDHRLASFMKANSSYVIKLLNKEKTNSFEKHVDAISFQTKSGKALKKVFYKNPINLRYNQQLYRLGLKDVNHRLTFFNTLERLALLTASNQYYTTNEILEFNYLFYENYSFFRDILEFAGEKKALSLIKQLNELVKSFEVLYNLQIGNLKKLSNSVKFETFKMGSFDIKNFRGTPMLKKYDDFKETKLLYKRLCASVSELDEKHKLEFKNVIHSSFEGKNFHEIHENLSGVASAINSIKLQIPLNYTDDDRRFEGVFGDYEFFLPEKVVDFTKFGNQFSNCVASYVSSVMSKETLIVIARDAKTKKLKLCIELSGSNNKYTKGNVRSSLQYKSFYNNRPKEKDLPSLIKWYESLKINNARCLDTYWIKEKNEKPINNIYAPEPISASVTVEYPFLQDLRDEDLPF